MATFLRIFMAVYIVVGVLLTWLAFLMQPYSGDLTRIGGFLENDFGNNLPQEKFQKPLFTLADSLAQYDRHYDVVVVGDSFSMNKDYGWQNYLANATGWSVLTFHQDNISIHELLRSPQFRQSPPSLFIFEQVERNLKHSLIGFKKPDGLKKHATMFEIPPAKPLHQIPKLVYRPTNRVFSMDEPINHIKVNVKTLFGSTEVFRHSLRQRDLFSCRRSDEILIYSDDWQKDDIKIEQWNQIEQRFADLQKAVESNGRTQMITMIAPDKTTAYCKYIENLEDPCHGTVQHLLGKKSIRIAPLEKRLQEIIDAGVVDVYLPNDTHWGFAGHKAVAGAIMERITGW